MDRDEVWRAIDAERGSLADLLDSLGEQEWEIPSLCADWRIRDVAAHLTLAQMRPLPVVVAAVRARGNFNRMVHDTAVRQARRLPVQQYGPRLRAMAGSRRKAPGVSHLEPLIDVLVHGQDIAIPLGRSRPTPVRAVAAAADRVWPSLFPWRAERTLSRYRLVATDCSWSAGDGLLVEGPIGAILLLLTGRRAGLARLSGPGARELRSARPASCGSRVRSGPGSGRPRGRRGDGG
ncbi:MAG: maleylpyruvate isomerase family mycothiol-dependent enzyme [Streptosporangiaceae bacterium]